MLSSTSVKEMMWSYSRAELGAGFTISSAEDLTHYLIAQLNGGRYGDAQILSPERVAEMHKPAVSTQPGGPSSSADESYANVGNGELHIAHVLWGGLLLFVAYLLCLLFANRWAYTAGALSAGVGVGLFIDEVGKFITQNNDHFFPAAAPIIYAFSCSPFCSTSRCVVRAPETLAPSSTTPWTRSERYWITTSTPRKTPRPGCSAPRGHPGCRPAAGHHTIGRCSARVPGL